MGRLLDRLLKGDRTLFDVVDGSSTIKGLPGLQEWRGPFWLPESSPVEPGGNHCLVRDDGRAGELIVDRFEIRCRWGRSRGVPGQQPFRVSILARVRPLKAHARTAR